MQEAWDQELHFWLHRFLSKVEKHLSICRDAAFLGGRGAGERAQDEALPRAQRPGFLSQDGASLCQLGCMERMLSQELGRWSGWG